MNTLMTTNDWTEKALTRAKTEALRILSRAFFACDDNRAAEVVFQAHEALLDHPRANGSVAALCVTLAMAEELAEHEDDAYYDESEDSPSMERCRDCGGGAGMPHTMNCLLFPRGGLLHKMGNWYEEWMDSQGLERMSADEARLQKRLTEYQRDWLDKFLALWGATENG